MFETKNTLQDSEGETIIEEAQVSVPVAQALALASAVDLVDQGNNSKIDITMTHYNFHVSISDISNNRISMP